MPTNFCSPLSFVAVFGSGIRDPGSGMGKNRAGINFPTRNTELCFCYCGAVSLVPHPNAVTTGNAKNLVWRPSDTFLFIKSQIKGLEVLTHLFRQAVPSHPPLKWIWFERLNKALKRDLTRVISIL